MDVYFFLPGEPTLEPLRRLDPDRDWRHFVRGEDAWILQTYLRLRTLGARSSWSRHPRTTG